MNSAKLKVKKKARNEGRPGYKKTRVGWIPEEWECMRLKEVSDINPEALSDKTDQNYMFHYIDLSTVSEGKLNLPSNKIAFREAPSRARRKVKKNDVLLATVRPNLKGFAYISFEANDIVCSTGYAVLRSKNEVISLYLFYNLFSHETERYFYSCVVGSNYPALNNSDVNNLRIPLPPLPEQKKIAEILSAWDWAIEQVGKLIDAKERLKKGLMQQLLTGRMRFPEFGKPVEKKGQLPEEWREVQLKDIAAVLFSGVDKKSRPGQKKVRLCNYMVVYNNNYITADMDFMWATASDAEIDKFSLDIGDIMITKDSETPNDIGVSSVVTEKLYDVVCGYHLALIKPNLEKIDPIFLTKQIGNERVANQFSRLANGVTRFGLTTTSVKCVRLWLPKIEEQTRIAAVLSACDREIELLKKKQEKLKEQKKGLMQKLLSGEVRHPEFLQ